MEQAIAAVDAGGDDADLADRFAGTLEFGTAGLRGALGAGSNRMNRIVVTRAAAGLAAYLKDTGHAGGSVVIGFDARHNSDAFARDTAEVMTGAGFKALVMPRPLPTPLLAFAIRELGCAAGVMVTASHNPPQDNGYKVYPGDGSQIVPPFDIEIAERIAAVGAMADVPRGSAGITVEEEIVDRYLDRVAGLAGDGPRDLTIVYTPLHGVGGDSVIRVLETAGFSAPHVVAQQEEPDPEFPTVAFPNPEEPGAMDLAMALAAEKKADIVVANDPDADRCAVAVPGGPHGWRMLRGDEVGALLGHHLLALGHEGTYANSIVSSSLLGKMAEAAGQPHEETLTGFKWISRAPGLAFGYEEALGYCVDPDHVKDKDGVSALLLMCEIAAAAKADGRTLNDLLDDIAAEHGLHATDQLSVRFDDPAEIPATMQRLRETPPASLGGLAVERIDDLSPGSDALPPTDGLRFALADGARVIVRPSGTEPKVKCYLEVVIGVDPEDGVDAARIAAAGRLDAIKGDIKVAAGL
ncbi:phospho-sugar mutase [Nocardioides sp. B-3]|uniref:phospho-sugar mutase n=1 Tax=Nocardioides sp. B-3 TaxID=2895565 RepID=UPI003FA5C77C